MKIVFPVLAAAMAASGFAAVSAAQTAETATTTGRERIRQVIVYGNDPCPRGSGDEIVVCARRPDNERYRIPETLREGERRRDGESWAVRAESLETMGETGIESCSTVGPGGFTGCWAEMMRQARAARRNAQPRPQ
ncbi:MAG TPA: hypothetical protein VGD10_11450 [Allosphingosinicella sp.]|uniref:hypothetical protein n=1 Tax=Allosphingosinicella sp. TaxID=2823234 RepID=UPI002EDB364F